jgi:hypothetical protein
VGWSAEITIYFNVIRPEGEGSGILEKTFFQSKFVPLPSLI